MKGPGLRLALVVAALVTGGSATLVCGKVHGLDFGPFTDGRDPSSGAVISEAELRRHLETVAPQTEWVRTYAMAGGLDATGRLAHSLGLKVAAGVWLGRDAAANRRELDRGIALARAGEADMLIVGSETLLRGDLAVATLVSYVREARAAVPAAVPVTTADTADAWLANPALLAEVDAVLINEYPFWRGVPLEDAPACLHQAWLNVRAKAGGKPVMLSETGWPSAGGAVRGALPSGENAAAYFRAVSAWAATNRVPVFYFAAFDEPWKRAAEGERGAHWGVWDASGQLKPGMGVALAGSSSPLAWTGREGLRVTAIPRFGSTESLAGVALGVDRENFRILCYLFVNGGWWVKPTSAQPLTEIGADGVWETSVTTGGIDHLATAYQVLLVPRAYVAPVLLGAARLPAELDRFPQVRVNRDPSPVSRRLTNISVRARAGDAARPLIVGFSLQGSGQKRLLLRGIGPALASFGVGGFAADPRLRVLDGMGNPVAANDDWSGDAALAAAALRVGAFALPVAARDAGALAILGAGNFTVHISAAAGEGVVLGEAYDADVETPTARLANVSARASLGAQEVLIAGFSITGATSKAVLIRGIGPGLARLGVSGGVRDPKLELFRGDAIVTQNDNWSAVPGVATVFDHVGAFALASGSLDAALYVALQPGSYTAVVSSVDGTPGAALIEVYEVE